ncbi:hypothetical protein SPPR111872_12660 [Sphingobacterium prati]
MTQIIPTTIESSPYSITLRAVLFLIQILFFLSYLSLLFIGIEKYRLDVRQLSIISK